MTAIVIHGGAGALRRDRYTEQEIQSYEECLTHCVQHSKGLLAQGSSAIETVQAAVTILEDFPLFNAGTGGVFSDAEKVEMDASIMCGNSGSVGGVGAVERLKNPIQTANLVRLHSPHALIVGAGAEKFAVDQGKTLIDPKELRTEKRYQDYLEAKKRGTVELDHGNSNATSTVGAVAMDNKGHLAAATSTGGLSYKHTGRVGDTAIIGAGTYACDKTCAISGTGTGDIFIQTVLCYDVHAQMHYQNLGLSTACANALERLHTAGGYGGVIAIDHKGTIAMPFNSGGMFRASIDAKDQMTVKIFAEDN